MSINCLTTKQHGEWRETLEETFQHDWYHLPGTHSLAERNEEGTGCLFVHREGPYLVAVPLLVRPLEAVPGLGAAGEGWNDATSVYGYAGPVASHECVPAPVIAHFQSGLCEILRQMRVVSVFSRLHPLIAQRHLLEGLGELTATGQTVSIDLTLPPDVQFRQFHKGHRQDIKKAKALGVVCVEDKERVYLNDLVDLYHQSMRRLNAAPYYYFDRAYFEGLFKIAGCEARLFAVLLDGQLINASVDVACRGIVQGHLCGTRRDALKLAPMKVYIDTVRRLAADEGHKAYHIGGGLGGRDDSLFQFKKGFSPRRHDFFTWRWVVEPGLYKALCQARIRNALQSGPAPDGAGFFPAYRAPVAPAEETSP